MDLSAQFNLPSSFPVIWQGKTGYEKARIDRVFNFRRPSRFPLAVVEATNEQHIVEAVRLAHAIGGGCRVAVRSGGHSWAAWSVRDRSVLIDLGRYHHFHLDEVTGIAQVSPSTTGRLLNSLLSSRGRMFPGGHCPEVAVGGFLLQGGMGWNCKNWGWACERVLAVDVVTAEGKKLHCDKNKNADLYWAARGAGPGFPAIVTRFYLQTVPAYSHVQSAAYFYEKQDFRKAFEWIASIAGSFDKDTEIVGVSNYPSGADDVQFMVMLTTFKNSKEEAHAALQPAEDSAPQGYVQHWFGKETSVLNEYDDQHAANPHSHRYVVENCYVKNADDTPSGSGGYDLARISEILEPAFTKLASRKSFSLWYSMNPCSRRRNGTDAGAAPGGPVMADMALSMQSDHYFAAYVVCEDASEDASCRRWVQDTMRRIEPHSEGAYLGDSDFQQRRTRFWGDEQGERLRTIRKKWDPQGVVAGYLDEGDRSGTEGLANVHEWKL